MVWDISTYTTCFHWASSCGMVGISPVAQSQFLKSRRNGKRSPNWWFHCWLSWLFCIFSSCGYMSKKFKLDLIVYLYYWGNLKVRLAWNVPYDREGLQRQNFLLYPFPWLENWCAGPFYALCVTSEKEMKFNLTCFVVACMMRILSIDFYHLLYISWLIVQHQDWVFP